MHGIAEKFPEERLTHRCGKELVVNADLAHVEANCRRRCQRDRRGWGRRICLRSLCGIDFPRHFLGARLTRVLPLAPHHRVARLGLLTLSERLWVTKRCVEREKMALLERQSARPRRRTGELMGNEAGRSTHRDEVADVHAALRFARRGGGVPLADLMIGDFVREESARRLF